MVVIYQQGKRTLAKTANREKKSEDRATVIAIALRSAIIEQAVKAGTRLPEDAIGEQFGASRTVVRSALSQLASEGLVQQRKNRSAIVAEPSWKEARDTFDLRLAVEEIVVRRLASTITKEQLKILRRHVDEEEKAQNDNELHSIRLAGEFHSLLAEFTNSEILATYMRELASRCCLILALYSRPHSSECGVSEHRKLLDLLEEGKEEKLAAAMHSHMKGVMERALISPPKKEAKGLNEVLSAYVPV